MEPERAGRGDQAGGASERASERGQSDRASSARAAGSARAGPAQRERADQVKPAGQTDSVVRRYVSRQAVIVRVRGVAPRTVGVFTRTHRCIRTLRHGLRSRIRARHRRQLRATRRPSHRFLTHPSRVSRSSFRRSRHEFRRSCDGYDGWCRKTADLGLDSGHPARIHAEIPEFCTAHDQDRRGAMGDQ